MEMMWRKAKRAMGIGICAHLLAVTGDRNDCASERRASDAFSQDSAALAAAAAHASTPKTLAQKIIAAERSRAKAPRRRGLPCSLDNAARPPHCCRHRGGRGEREAAGHQARGTLGAATPAADATVEVEYVPEKPDLGVDNPSSSAPSRGEDKDSFWRVVAHCTAGLPEDKPRYIMGVGYLLDIVVCSALGADMYDCVYPTRTTRFGSTLVPEGVLKLKQNAMATDEQPIDPSCPCLQKYTRAYLHCLVTKDPMGSQLLSYHNLSFMMRLSRDLHMSILEGRFSEYVVSLNINLPDLPAK
ncbi:Queuine tRNA-ribosyltransferase [Hordeum vulgare]|nr:Queuine tRNA-ribosyltransferase [Hordeum vulgare]